MAPLHLARSAGCRIYDAAGREWLDYVMALGAVALGYGHPAVNAAVFDAVERGTIGALAPDDEEALAAELALAIPLLEQVRFLKTGAEAVAAAVRIARVATGRDAVLGCGYHGWLDWCSSANGVPDAVRQLYSTVPFNDIDGTVAAIRAGGDRLACVVAEPVIDGAPDVAWLRALRDETERCGAVLIFDEVKTAFRVSVGGAAERWGVRPDLMVIGKALANGYPLAAVGGRAALMRSVADTWISSTMATEYVSLAAAGAVVRIFRREPVVAHLAARGAELERGLHRVAAAHPALIESVGGIAEMCHLNCRTPDISARVAVAAAARGLLWKRGAYNFVSLAHTAVDVEHACTTLDQALHDLATGA
jgi:glutamate-1-semialdehyde 2,1-aminomutase